MRSRSVHLSGTTHLPFSFTIRHRIRFTGNKSSVREAATHTGGPEQSGERPKALTLWQSTHSSCRRQMGQNRLVSFDSCWLPCFGADLLNVLRNNGTPVPRPRLALVKTNASDAPQNGPEETVQSVHSVRLAEDVHIVEEREHVFPVLQLPSKMFQRALYPD